MIYNESKVQRVYEANFREAQRQLQNLPVCSGIEPNFPGLADWIFEQTVQHCVRRELEEMNLDTEIEEQVMSEGAIFDLQIGNTVIDAKPGRSFSEDDIAECLKNQIEAKKRNWSYLFLCLYENDFRSNITGAFGEENTVILQNSAGEWERFIGLIAKSIKN